MWCALIVPVRIGSWHLQSSRVSIITIHYPSGDQAHTSGDTSNHLKAKVVYKDYRYFYLQSCNSLHNTLCGLTYPCVLCIDAWCWQIFAHLANVSPQSPQSPAPWVESRANIRWLILSCGAPLGVVITHSFKRRFMKISQLPSWKQLQALSHLRLY